MSVKDGDVAILHHLVFVYHHEAPSSVESGVATRTFAQGDVGYRIRTKSMVADIVGNFGKSRVHVTIGIARVPDVTGSRRHRSIWPRAGTFDLHDAFVVVFGHAVLGYRKGIR